MNTTISQKKAALKQRLSRLNERERRLDARRKILLGGWLLASMRRDPQFREEMASGLRGAGWSAADRPLIEAAIEQAHAGR
ncbi:MAG: hypothetical protein AB7E55_18260 [Pigmentiphaga sp.]